MEAKGTEETKETKEGGDQEDVTDALNAIYAEEESCVDEVLWQLQYASLVEKGAWCSLRVGGLDQ
ncbi:MAG: hypothetical protein MAG431_01316 [Chloroflexi bacterium]|nr:hypothetical protein [Chloroflexota bacterium]